jgi:hypothetical protein
MVQFARLAALTQPDFSHADGGHLLKFLLKFFGARFCRWCYPVWAFRLGLQGANMPCYDYFRC